VAVTVVAGLTPPPAAALMAGAALTLHLAAVRTAVAGLTLRLRVATALIPPPAADVAIPHHEAVVAAEAGAIVPAAVVATAADIDKLTLLVSPKTGAAAGTSTQPATAPAFLLTYSTFSNSNLCKESSDLILLRY
jgi:hypothetical protein